MLALIIRETRFYLPFLFNKTTQLDFLLLFTTYRFIFKGWINDGSLFERSWPINRKHKVSFSNFQKDVNWFSPSIYSMVKKKKKLFIKSLMIKWVWYYAALHFFFLLTSLFFFKYFYLFIYCSDDDTILSLIKESPSRVAKNILSSCIRHHKTIILDYAISHFVELKSWNTVCKIIHGCRFVNFDLVCFF